MSSLPHFKYIIGLGNPGLEYQDTYHNVGTSLIDTLVPDFDIRAEKTPLFSWLKQDKMVFIKPHIFMNDSGKAIKKLALQLKWKADTILLIHDDSDLSIGTYKFSYGRGAAGHRGVLSVMKALKTEKFWRLRIGIRTPSKKREKALAIVLQKISPKNKKILHHLIPEISLNLRLNATPDAKVVKLVRGRSIS